METYLEKFGASIYYAVSVNEAAVFRFCEKYGYAPMNAREAIQDVAAIMAGYEGAAEEFFKRVHPDHDVFQHLQDSALADAPTQYQALAPQIDFSKYFEIRLTLKDLFLLGFAALVFYLIQKK